VIAALLALALVHDSGVSSSRIETIRDDVRGTFTFSLEDLASLVRLDANRDGLIDSEEWARALPAIFGYVGDHFQIDGCRSEGDGSVRPGLIRANDLRAPVTLVLRFLPARPLDRLRIRCDLFREHGGYSRHVAELPGGGTVVFDAARREADRPLAPSEGRWPWAAGSIAVLAALIPIFRTLSKSA
jgi:hypothetical protein